MNTNWQKLTTILFGFLLTFVSFVSGQDHSTAPPLKQAHSHNDYLQNNPLHDALVHGFCSVEADIFLVGGQLLVGHYRWTLRPEMTLKKLYLDPLKNRVEQFDGKVYPNGPLFILLIDIKEHGDAVYPVLKNLLQQYESMLSGMRGGKYEHRAIQVVISGSCPRRLIMQDRSRLVSIDGRLSDLESDTPPHLIPMISAKWGSTFKWRGRSTIKDSEKEKLKSIVAKAHKKNRRVRFWASPESSVVWERLLAEGIDHINTDDLKKLSQFLKSKQ